MVSQSWDGKRLYFTSSLLANWDKKTVDSDPIQFFKAYDWDGKKLAPKFEIDFLAAGLGAPHQMRFGAYALYARAPLRSDDGEVTADASSRKPMRAADDLAANAGHLARGPAALGAAAQH
jgi:selenium-binding protein 1